MAMEPPRRFWDNSDDIDYISDHLLHTTSRSRNSSSSSENDSGSREIKQSSNSGIDLQYRVPYLKDVSPDTVLKLVDLCLLYNPDFSGNGDLSIQHFYETLDSISPEWVAEILDNATPDLSESTHKNSESSDAAASTAEEENRHERAEAEEHYSQKKVEQRVGTKVV